MFHPSNEDPYIAAAYMVICFCSAFVASILNNVEIIVRVGVGATAIVSAVFAARYYHYAAKEKKESIKKIKSES